MTYDAQLSLSEFAGKRGMAEAAVRVRARALIVSLRPGVRLLDIPQTQLHGDKLRPQSYRRN